MAGSRLHFLHSEGGYHLHKLYDSLKRGFDPTQRTQRNKCKQRKKRNKRNSRKKRKLQWIGTELSSFQLNWIFQGLKFKKKIIVQILVRFSA